MSSKDYELKAASSRQPIPPPDLEYKPPLPRAYAPSLGLVGCGGITENHLQAYRDAGWNVAVLCDLNREAAEERRRAFYPEAEVVTDLSDVLAREDVEVIDFATHPDVRKGQLLAAMEAGRHVLSQKPLASNLDDARHLAEAAERCGVKAAVNQNGRWAPYLAWMQSAVRAGCIGTVNSVSMMLNWDHAWTEGTPFEAIKHLMLYDFGIHWFDATSCFFEGRTPLSVAAQLAPSVEQKMEPPLQAGVVLRFENGLAVLQFNGHSLFGVEESITVCGTRGTLRSRGEPVAASSVELHTAEGVATAELEGAWFNDGFRGTMGELLCAIEDDRPPRNSFRNNLGSLALCFSAMKSADLGSVVAVPST